MPCTQIIVSTVYSAVRPFDDCFIFTDFVQDFPEHRLKFFRFLKAVNTHCFRTLFEIPPEHQKLVVDSVVWAFKHTERNIGEARGDVFSRPLPLVVLCCLVRTRLL